MPSDFYAWEHYIWGDDRSARYRRNSNRVRLTPDWERDPQYWARAEMDDSGNPFFPNPGYPDVGDRWRRNETPYNEDRWNQAGPYRGRGPRDYRRTDQSIKDDICERLTRHGYIDASNVEISVENGEVTLSGTTATRKEKRLAEDLAESVRGVSDVHNRIHLDYGNKSVIPHPVDQYEDVQPQTSGAHSQQDSQGKYETDDKPQEPHLEQGMAAHSGSEFEHNAVPTSSTDKNLEKQESPMENNEITRQTPGSVNNEASQPYGQNDKTIPIHTEQSQPLDQNSEKHEINRDRIPPYTVKPTDPTIPISSGDIEKNIERQPDAERDTNPVTQTDAKSQIREGMQVLGYWSEEIGTVKAVGDDQFLLDRPMARDLYVPFGAVKEIRENKIILRVPAEEISTQGWQNPPLF